MVNFIRIEKESKLVKRWREPPKHFTKTRLAPSHCPLLAPVKDEDDAVSYRFRQIMLRSMNVLSKRA